MLELITTILEVAGVLLIDAGVAIAMGTFGLPVALIVGGVLLLGSSLLLIKAATR